MAHEARDPINVAQMVTADSQRPSKDYGFDSGLGLVFFLIKLEKYEHLRHYSHQSTTQDHGIWDNLTFIIVWAPTLFPRQLVPEASWFVFCESKDPYLMLRLASIPPTYLMRHFQNHISTKSALHRSSYFLVGHSTSVNYGWCTYFWAKLTSIWHLPYLNLEFCFGVERLNRSTWTCRRSSRNVHFL